MGWGWGRPCGKGAATLGPSTKCPALGRAESTFAGMSPLSHSAPRSPSSQPLTPTRALLGGGKSCALTTSQLSPETASYRGVPWPCRACFPCSNAFPAFSSLQAPTPSQFDPGEPPERPSPPVPGSVRAGTAMSRHRARTRRWFCQVEMAGPRASRTDSQHREQE